MTLHLEKHSGTDSTGLMEIVTKCKECQFFQKQTTKHANPLRPIDLSCSFAVWGIDIVGVLPRAPGDFKILIRRHRYIH
jgi:hypothetical protein